MVIYLVAFFVNLNPIWQALLAGFLTLSVTTLGSAVVYFFKTVNKNIMDAMLALSSGIMLAASYFSLLEPAIETAKNLHTLVWLVIFSGFITGGVILFIGDKILDIIYSKKDDNSLFSFKRCIMLFTSITLHNIPEGLVIGVAFGAVLYGLDTANLLSAITLTIAIALQNFPEGSAISLPLRREGMSRFKSFLFGSLSGVVEPIAAVIGAFLVIKVQSLLPFIMSFTAGAMIFVITMELIPESQTNSNRGLMALLTMFGFSIMMILELILS